MVKGKQLLLVVNFWNEDNLSCIFQMENIISGIKDVNLKLTLAFGIGIHHAGLVERDRKNVEELFVNQKIQVIDYTSH